MSQETLSRPRFLKQSARPLSSALTQMLSVTALQSTKTSSQSLKRTPCSTKAGFRCKRRILTPWQLGTNMSVQTNPARQHRASQFAAHSSTPATSRDHSASNKSWTSPSYQIWCLSGISRTWTISRNYSHLHISCRATMKATLTN